MSGHIEQGIAGGSAMKTGSVITILSAVGTWLTDHADLFGAIAILVGMTVGVAGFVVNVRSTLARERREKIEHELTVERLMRGDRGD